MTYPVLLALILLYAGCTANPQDLAKPGSSSNTGGSITGEGIGQDVGAQQTVALTMEEVARHNTPADCWMVINGNVYDLSAYKNHPGGDAYLLYCGKDGTQAYNSIKNGRGHSKYADSLLEGYLVGAVGDTVTIKR